MAVDFTAETMTNWAREELDWATFRRNFLKQDLSLDWIKDLIRWEVNMFRLQMI